MFARSTAMLISSECMDDIIQFGMDLSDTSSDILRMIMCSMPHTDRFNCALVCKAWAEAATAATHSIILERKDNRTLSSLPLWMQKYWNQVDSFQLQKCLGTLELLPCAQLQDLQLHGKADYYDRLVINIAVWTALRAASSLTSLSLQQITAACAQQDVVSAVAGLPRLQQLSWRHVRCYDQEENGQPSDVSLLLQQLTQLTRLELWGVTAEALQHLRPLSKLQQLGIFPPEAWAKARCPGLQELTAVTSLDLFGDTSWYAGETDIPAGISQLAALQHLHAQQATDTGLFSMQALTSLTCLRVSSLRTKGGSQVPLQLPALQQLELQGAPYESRPLKLPLLACSTELRRVSLSWLHLEGISSLVANSMLQHLALDNCNICDSVEAQLAGVTAWQQVFPGPGQLPHLTSLELTRVQPMLQDAGAESMVACCSSLQALHLAAVYASMLSTLVRLPAVTSLRLGKLHALQCPSVVQLTGLRKLQVDNSGPLSVEGLRQLAALQQLIILGFGRAFDLKRVSSTLQEHFSDTPSGCPHGMVNKVRAMGGIGCSLPSVLGAADASLH